jgi:hypothetical protein
LHLEDRNSEALEAIKEAEALVEISGRRNWCAELKRCRGVFLAPMGADETQIEASFRAAINTAKHQKSVSLANERKHPTQNTAAKKRLRQGEVDSEYLFGKTPGTPLSREISNS